MEPWAENVPTANGSSMVPFRGEPNTWKQVATIRMHDLLAQLKLVMAASGRARTEAQLSEDAEGPNCAPLCYVAKWADYTQNYGFGYQLSDGTIGVSFNDGSKILVKPDNNQICYIDGAGQEYFYTKENIPANGQKKLSILNYFQEYMADGLTVVGGQVVKSDYPVVHSTRLWAFFLTKRAVYMVLTNGTLQINTFWDHAKTILCPVFSAISILEPSKPMKTYKFAALRANGCTPDLIGKINDGIEKLEVLLGLKLGHIEIVSSLDLDEFYGAPESKPCKEE